MEGQDSKMRILCTSILALLAGLAPGWSRAQPPAGGALLEHVELIDGRGGPPLHNVDMLIENGRVAAVGAHLSRPAGARVIDLTGRTIIPGLISDHSHVGLVDGVSVGPQNFTRPNILRQLRQYEAYGVTTVTALGLTRPSVFDPLRQEMHAGGTPGADLFGVDQGVGAPAGAPPAAMLPVAPDQLFRPATPDETRRAVDEMASHGTDLVKLWLDDLRNNTEAPPRPKMPPEIYRAVIAEAHAKGLRVAGHIYDLEDAKALVDAGVDILAHGVRDRPVDAEFVDAMKRRGVWYIPTLSLDETTYVFAEHPELLRDAFLNAALQPELRAHLADPAWRAKALASPAVAGAKRALALNEQNLKTLYDAGVKIGFGTDSGATPLRVPGWAEHRELQLLVSAGLTPLQALTLATGKAAALLGLEDRGVLAPGERADFVVLSADPSVSIANAAAIEAVWRGGRPAPRPSSRR
jgi:imidazolonepropionase-like amidohydrolase